MCEVDLCSSLWLGLGGTDCIIEAWGSLLWSSSQHRSGLMCTHSPPRHQHDCNYEKGPNNQTLVCVLLYPIPSVWLYCHYSSLKNLQMETLNQVDVLHSWNSCVFGMDSIYMCWINIYMYTCTHSHIHIHCATKYWGNICWVLSTEILKCPHSLDTFTNPVAVNPNGYIKAMFFIPLTVFCNSTIPTCRPISILLPLNIIHSVNPATGFISFWIEYVKQYNICN